MCRRSYQRSVVGDRAVKALGICSEAEGIGCRAASRGTPLVPGKAGTPKSSVMQIYCDVGMKIKAECPQHLTEMETSLDFAFQLCVSLLLLLH